MPDMTEKNSPAFDFDELSSLARNDPERFAKTRDALIKTCMARSGTFPGLDDLQRKLDADRYSVGPGMTSCDHYLASMQHSIGRLKRLAEQLERALQDAPN
ncbi:MAG: DUF3135 domain-containing protein [Rhodocyclaceae bacterium]|nr:DUF3135 domain-containing protein [Rhodocyclaceae bacterium]